MNTDEADLTFETALEGLERIVNDLERGDLDLSASLAGYERGVALLSRCQSLLDGVDRSVAMLTGVDADGTPITTPFDASATAAIASEPAKPAPKPSRTKKPKPFVPEAEGFGEGDGLDFDPPF